jgi:carbon storage regulator CsrA
MIGDGIEITIVETKPGSVKLGVDAPKHLAIVRDDARPIR